MINISKPFLVLLEQSGNNFDNWNKIEVDHSMEYSQRKMFKSELLKKLKNELKNGVYCYQDSSKVIYVGVGKPIINRLYSHFIEANNRAEKSRGELWNKFFSQDEYRKLLTVYWIEVDYENSKSADYLRRTIEAYISIQHKVVFDEWYSEQKLLIKSIETTTSLD